MLVVLRGDVVILGVILDVVFIADEFKFKLLDDFRVDDVLGDMVCEKFLRGVVLNVVSAVVVVEDAFIRFANGGDVVVDDNDDEDVDVDVAAEAEAEAATG